MDIEAGGELRAAPGGRRRSAEERRLIVEETLGPGASVARVARKHGVNANQVLGWRKLYQSGRLGVPAGGMTLLPVTMLEEQELPRAMPEPVVAAPSGSMHIELPGRAACWAHARRKFHEIHAAHPSPTTTEAIERIAALYAIEKEIRGSPAEIRRSIRQARAAPLLHSMQTWLENTLARLSKKSDTAAAIRYALSRWRALTRYVDDGALQIDNNAAERALRVVALGRKNFLFAGSDAGGERAAALYSLLGSAKLNGLDPELYLHHVLERIADHPLSRLEELLPWNVSIDPLVSPTQT